MESDIQHQSSSEAFATLSGDGGHLTVSKLKMRTFTHWVRKYVSDLVSSNELARRRAPRIDRAVSILIAKAETSDGRELLFKEFDEFVRVIKDPSNEHPFQAELTWRLFDTDGEGSLVSHQLVSVRTMLSKLGLTCGDSAFDKFLSTADNLCISCDEYYAWFATLVEQRPQTLKTDADPHDRFVRETFLEISNGNEYLTLKLIKSRTFSEWIREYLTDMSLKGVVSPSKLPRTDRAVRIVVAKAEIVDSKQLSYQEFESVMRALRNLSPTHSVEAELTWHLFDTARQGFLPTSQIVLARAMLSKLELVSDNKSFEELLATADDDCISSGQYYEWCAKLVDQRRQCRKPVIDSAADADPRHQLSREAYASLTSDSGGRLTLNQLKSRMFVSWVRMYVTDMTLKGVLSADRAPQTQRAVNILIAKAEVAHYRDISFEEFHAFTSAIKDPSPEFLDTWRSLFGDRALIPPEAELTWRLLDTSGLGFLTLEQVSLARRMLSRLQLSSESDLFEQLLETADEDRISFSNFSKWFSKLAGKRLTPRKQGAPPTEPAGCRDRLRETDKQSSPYGGSGESVDFQLPEGQAKQKARPSAVKAKPALQALGMTFANTSASGDQNLRSAEIAALTTFTPEFLELSLSPRVPASRATWAVAMGTREPQKRKPPMMRQEKDMAFGRPTLPRDQLARSADLASLKLYECGKSPLKDRPLNLSEIVWQPTPRHASARKWPGIGLPPTISSA
eukprot:TRINITY_DN10541_c0_g2_i1.p1 TRINITY_DN10541_c0_g2~~TRINITY_DN10541_c0_g2_i1.p1  ORF type:complete len:736 (+),score=98.24 TRINITY_DN10541_c0_g2_i1:70-2277(+)